MLKDRSFSLTAGFYQLAAITLAVLYAAAAQNNGAAYILAFGLICLCCVGAVHGLRNVAGVDARIISVSPGYAPSGSDVTCGYVDVRVTLHNLSSASRFACKIALPGFLCMDEGAFVMSLASGAMQEVVVRIKGLPRGHYGLSKVRVQSLYPFGLVRVTRELAVKMVEFWVYPAPARGGEIPAAASSDSGAGGGGSGGDDFVGVRAYQLGESQRHVDWKAVSRGSPMMVKQFGGGNDRAVILDWDLLPGDAEGRLSSLCFWLLEADREGFRYGLRLPGVDIPSGLGAGHLHHCLRSLASFPAVRNSAHRQSWWGRNTETGQGSRWQALRNILSDRRNPS